MSGFVDAVWTDFGASLALTITVYYSVYGSGSNIIMSYFWALLTCCSELLNAVISHPPLYFKPSDQRPAPPLSGPHSLCVGLSMGFCSHKTFTHTHTHTHTKQLLPAGAKVIAEVTFQDGAASPDLCPGYTQKVWGCSLKFAFLHKGWHVCQGCTGWSAHNGAYYALKSSLSSVIQSMNLDCNKLNLDWIWIYGHLSCLYAKFLSSVERQLVVLKL